MSEGGVLAIKGLKSQFYISMNRTGQLQGKVTVDLLKKYKDNFVTLTFCNQMPTKNSL